MSTATKTKLSTDLIHSTVMRSMFNHLTKTFTVDQAREILVQKYPNSRSEINKMEMEMEDNNATPSTTDDIAAAIAAAKKPKTAKATKPKKVAAPKTPKPKRVTKMDQARELYKAESDKSRKNMIAVFSTKLGLSPAAASTYFYTVKS